MKKKELAILLSQLETLSKPHSKLEQYQTEGDLAAIILWNISLQGNVEGKTIADLGCGNGIFGIGALLLGAKEVYFVDVDEEAITIAKKNKQTIEKKLGIKFKGKFIKKDIKLFKKQVDVVIQNPPFGVQQAHADKQFLEVSMRVSQKIYSIHKIESKRFIEAVVKEKGYRVSNITPAKFPLKKTQDYHKKKSYTVEIGVWEIERFKNSL